MSQKDSQEDQGTLKQLGGSLLAILLLPGPHGLPGSSLGSLELSRTSLRKAPPQGVRQSLRRGHRAIPEVDPWLPPSSTAHLSTSRGSSAFHNWYCHHAKLVQDMM